ncbi:DUF6640 family protein [Granulicella sp. S156]|uniref:DUF6640 family protein n=1 Tax=Granulicella sp. S156 TaxID=1747224 RepID=UPI00131CF7F3|nr:DUF6640 family protein [Granulicella sp. S156]
MVIAKWIVAFVALYGFGGFVADAIAPSVSKQHLWNPRWPPHAKFHNGRTMTMGILGGFLSLFILFYFRPLTLPLLLIAAAVAGMYWVSMVFSPFFPGTAWFDPEFQHETKRPLGFSPQQLLTYMLCLLLIVAVVIAVRSTGG